MAEVIDKDRAFWDEFAPKYHQGPGRQTPQLAEELLIDAGPIGDALDLACGGGRTTALLRRAASGRVTGVDLSPAMLRLARAEHAEIEFVEASADALPFPAESFDFVLCSLGLMLFPEPAAALREVRRVLRPNGRMRLSVWGRPSHTTLMTLLPDVAAAIGVELPQPPRSNFALGLGGALEGIASTAGMRVVFRHFVPLAVRYADADAYLDEHGLRAAEPGPRMKEVPEHQRARLEAALRAEAGRRLELGGGALVLDSLLAELVPVDP